MAKTNKGIASRSTILTEARHLLNEKGLSITVDMIASELGLTRGRITHFFPTKDSLMVGIMRDYEHELSELIHQFDWGKGPDFANSVDIMDRVLDLQYEYRCAIAFLAITTKNQPELHQHIEGSYYNRIDGIRMRTSYMVEKKLLHPQILEKENWEVYCFQYTNLLTTWVISQEMYHSKKAYKKMKPVYILGAMNLYIPYLTREGKKAYDAAMVPYVSSISDSEKA
ncbi:TetR/AcrR family transcriptional regulator [Flavihumibacter rivuli]|uniref:TetR/AcrR family transcriptional regulator n=1 Tax=Flavihumibacter rivuli TaxID=2838156 RepID=UPI001BDECAF9|nr:helix-turn-helix domain-containing protein [Flavihumibacter rivuli]ULQ55813.1 TetR/AcrR family transcriptional regulator [Flavihumibacter rivuli]